MKNLALIGALMLGALLPNAAGAQSAVNFPTKPIRIIVPLAPGGSGDIFARVLAAKMGDNMKAAVIVENRAGGNTTIATNMVAKADPDGHTMTLITLFYATTPFMQKDMPYKVPDDFAPVALIVTYPITLVGRAGLPASNLKELIEYGQKNPGKLTYATAQSGGAEHLSMALLTQAAKVDMLRVPYQGAGPAVAALLSDQVDLLFTGYAAVAEHVKVGKLKVLGSTGSKRMPSAPDVATIAEQGVPNYEVLAFFGLITTAGTPRPVIDILNSEVKKAMDDPEVAKRTAVLGGDVKVSTPEELHTFTVQQTTKWQAIIKAANITSE